MFPLYPRDRNLTRLAHHLFLHLIVPHSLSNSKLYAYGCVGPLSFNDAHPFYLVAISSFGNRERVMVEQSRSNRSAADPRFYCSKCHICGKEFLGTVEVTEEISSRSPR